MTSFHKEKAFKDLQLSQKRDRFSLFFIFPKDLLPFCNIGCQDLFCHCSIHRHASDGTFHFTSTGKHPAIASESKIKTANHFVKTPLLKSLYLFLGSPKNTYYFSGVSMETRSTFCKGIPEVGVAQAVVLACVVMH